MDVNIVYKFLPPEYKKGSCNNQNPFIQLLIILYGQPVWMSISFSISLIPVTSFCYCLPFLLDTTANYIIWTACMDVNIVFYFPHSCYFILLLPPFFISISYINNNYHYYKSANYIIWTACMDVNIVFYFPHSCYFILLLPPFFISISYINNNYHYYKLLQISTF